MDGQRASAIGGFRGPQLPAGGVLGMVAGAEDR
jgi:hypothetical protein